MTALDSPSNHEEASSTATASAHDNAAWEMIEPGRYQPRRIRGSHRGRQLG